jgi:hypothetical protein
MSGILNGSADDFLECCATPTLSLNIDDLLGDMDIDG